MAQAYSHLHAANVYVEFLQNLAGTYPRLACTSQDSSIETASVIVRQQIPGVGAPSDKGAEESWLGEFSGLRGVNGEGQGGGRLASALATHRSRVMDVLRRVPPADARCVFFVSLSIERFLFAYHQHDLFVVLHLGVQCHYWLSRGAGTR